MQDTDYNGIIAALMNCNDLASIHKTVTAILQKNNMETPSLDSRLLICGSCAISYESFIAYPEQEISSGKLNTLATNLEKRLVGEPISRIFGTKEFWSHSFALNKDTLDPRPDTETLVEFALERITNQKLEDKPLRILDLGVGTGCIILSLLSELKAATGVGTDISRGALEAATQNAEKLGLADRVKFIQSDWMDNVDEQYDVILSNPPYIPSADILGLTNEVKDFDPRRALDGGTDGLDAYRKIVEQIYSKQNECLVLFEFGKGQEKDIKNLLMSYKTGKTFSNISYKCDLSGVIRCIAAEIKNETYGC